MCLLAPRKWNATVAVVFLWRDAQPLTPAPWFQLCHCWEMPPTECVPACFHVQGVALKCQGKMCAHPHTHTHAHRNVRTPRGAWERAKRLGWDCDPSCAAQFKHCCCTAEPSEFDSLSLKEKRETKWSKQQQCNALVNRGVVSPRGDPAIRRITTRKVSEWPYSH